MEERALQAAPGMGETLAGISQERGLIMRKKGDFHDHKLCAYCLRLIPLDRLRAIGNKKYICEEHERDVIFLRRKGK